MSSIAINDLGNSVELGRQALAGTMGGHGYYRRYRRYCRRWARRVYNRCYYRRPRRVCGFPRYY